MKIKKAYFYILFSILVTLSLSIIFKKLPIVNKITNYPPNASKYMQKIQNSRDESLKYGRDSYGIIDLRSTKISENCFEKISVFDLNNNMKFDDLTEWPQKIPEGFYPKKLIEEGMEKKLNLKKVHEKGYDGTGVGIAIIDNTLLGDHLEIKNNLKFYKSYSNENEIASMHGIAMASIAVGKNVGVAPNADLYYIADSRGGSIGKTIDFTYVAEDILSVVELNQSLKNKIRVISISTGYSQADVNEKRIKGIVELNNAIQKAKESNIEVLCLIPKNKINKFRSLTRTSYEDVTDFCNYKPYFPTDNPYGTLYVPTDKITYASNCGKSNYTYECWGGMSSIVPYVAGMYVLSCQADGNITFDDFFRIANETAYQSEYIFEIYGKQKFKIINPEAIINQLVS